MNSAFPPDWLAHHAARNPDAPALDSREHRVSYGALAERVRDLAGHLADRGVTAPDRVVVALPTSPAAAVAALAVQSLGACAVDIDRGLGRDGFSAVLRQSGARFAIVAGQDALHWSAAADGTELAATKLDRVLTTDPGMGVVRHVDAGYQRAVDVARERGVRVPMLEGIGETGTGGR